MSVSAPLQLRIFFSCPGDVADERGLARRVLARLNKHPSFRGRVRLDEISWDDPDASVPLAAHLTPQEAINRVLPKPSDCDLVVVVLWSRMRTPLPSEYRKPDGCPHASGAETDDLVARMRDPAVRVLAVVGPSGSGKSSLVAAGLLPRLAAGALPGSSVWGGGALHPRRGRGRSLPRPRPAARAPRRRHCR